MTCSQTFATSESIVARSSGIGRRRGRGLIAAPRPEPEAARLDLRLRAGLAEDPDIVTATGKPASRRQHGAEITGATPVGEEEI